MKKTGFLILRIIGGLILLIGAIYWSYRIWQWPTISFYIYLFGTRDNIIFALRIIGGIGTLLIFIELIRIFFGVRHPRLRQIAYKIGLFFGVFGILKLFATMIDVWILPGALTGAFINNLMVYWLAFFLRKRRIRINEINEDTETRNRLSANINEVLDEMRIGRKQIEKGILETAV